MRRVRACGLTGADAQTGSECKLTAHDWTGDYGLGNNVGAVATDTWQFGNDTFQREVVGTVPGQAECNVTTLTFRVNGTYTFVDGNLAVVYKNCNGETSCPLWNCMATFSDSDEAAVSFPNTDCQTVCLKEAGGEGDCLTAVVEEDDGPVDGQCGGDGGDGGSSSEVYLGIIISVCGNVLISVALNVQKFSHNKNNAAAEKKSYLLRPTWWLGMVLMGLGEAGNFLAYAFAPASIVAPLGTVALVSNAVIAPLVLKERFRPQDLLGIVLAIGGAIVVVRAAVLPHGVQRASPTRANKALCCRARTHAGR